MTPVRKTWRLDYVRLAAIVIATTSIIAMIRKPTIKNEDNKGEEIAATKLDGDVEYASERLKRSALSARFYGNFFIFLTIIIGLTILSTFTIVTQFRNEIVMQRRENTLKEYQSTLAHGDFVFENLARQLKQINSLADTDAALKKRMSDVLERNFVDSSKPPPLGEEKKGIVDYASENVVKVGTVLIGVFIIQILVGFTRYFYKLAEHLRMCSVIIKLSAGNIEDLARISPILLPSAIDFGKMPTSPFETIAENATRALGELSKKVRA